MNRSSFLRGGAASAAEGTYYRLVAITALGGLSASCFRVRLGQSGSLAKTAKAFGVPLILATVVAARGGKIIKGIQDVFPNNEPIDPTFINTWQDERVVTAVKATQRKKVVIASLWTQMCLAMPAIQGQGEGFEVYVVTDASGGVSPEAHDTAVRRMVQAGIVPITWMALLGEWQRDWAREKTLPDLANLLLEHGAATGVAYAWELQLLAENKQPGF